MDEAVVTVAGLVKEFKTELTYLTMMGGVICIAHLIVYLTDSIVSSFRKMWRSLCRITFKVIQKGGATARGVLPVLGAGKTEGKAIEVLPLGKEKESSNRTYHFRGKGKKTTKAKGKARGAAL